MTVRRDDMNPMGIMQGRVSPPLDGRIQSFPWLSWREEFARARSCGLDVIDWIFDAESWQANPLMTGRGLDAILDLIERTGVKLGSVCADFCMAQPLIRCSAFERNERLLVLRQLLRRCCMAGVPVVELPFVDNSAINNETEMEEVGETLTWLADEAAALDIVLALETSLGPEQLGGMLERLNHPSIKANYDIGNSASLGYDTTSELAAYGEHVVTVHVKDRLRGASTVPLGEGDADFVASFDALARAGYAGPFILQAARGGTDEIAWCRRNLRFVRRHVGVTQQQRIRA